MAAHLHSQSYPQLDIKLYVTNYHDWAFFVELFDDLDLFGHIIDLGSSDEMKTPFWYATDRRARVIITQFVVIDIHSELCTMRTTQAMWNYLRSHYQ